MAETNSDMERLCEDLNTEFDNVSAMYGNGELVVYLPLDDSNQPDPPGIDQQVIDYIERETDLDPTLDLDGQAVTADI